MYIKTDLPSQTKVGSVHGNVKVQGMDILFCYALEDGSVLGRFKTVYCAISLRIIRSVNISHFERTVNLEYERPAKLLEYRMVNALFRR